MSTLVDYIRWMGNFDFEKLPFSDPDAVILTLISYMDLTRLFRERDSIYVRDLKKLFERNRPAVKIVGTEESTRRVVEAAAKSRRFGDLRITDYVDILEDDPPLQFAAMTFRDGRRFAFIAYRGTDTAIAGWKEDFMISFTKTKSQELALSYAEKVIEYGPDWYLGGHSKGSNSALYAACLLPEEQWLDVRKVYLLDGPGFCPEVMDVNLIRRVEPKATCIIPEFSIVGKIFEPEIENTRIVKSSQDAVMQHAPDSWLIDHGDLMTVTKNAEGSVWLNGLVNDWIRDLPLSERPQMVDELFAVFEKAGAKDLSDLKPDTIADAVIELRHLSGTTKKNLTALPKKILMDDAELNLPKGGFLDRLKSSELLLALLLIVLGVGVFFISNSILEIVSLVVVISVTVFEIILLIRKLIKRKGRFEGLRERVIITIILLALIAVLLIKEQAMFFLGSIIFGVLFLVLAFVISDHGLKKTESRFHQVLSVIESILCLIFGFSFLLIPSATVPTYAIAISIALASDGLARLIYLFVRWLKRRNG